MDLFDHHSRMVMDAAKPLAERMRPRNLNEFVGQHRVVGPGTPIREAVEHDRLFSMILWGPPGCGKTTLAQIIANETQSFFTQFSAVLSGVKEIRAVIETATEQRKLYHKKTILFVDEIHRFNKSQQDAFLHHVESGLITLIGATTENPSFEVIAPLLSRCRVITLDMLAEEDIGEILDQALSDDQRGFGKTGLQLASEARTHLIGIADGDARMALNNLELVAAMQLDRNDPVEKPVAATITVKIIEQALQKKALRYDKSGEEHYNLISALHKSLRGSDPDAALYWMGRMLAAGEDPLYIARRLIRFACEDVGNADPFALSVAVNAKDAYHFLGHPEGELALAQATVYLATAPKSNRIYEAYSKVQDAVRRFGSLPTPHHIRNAPTRLMKQLGYGKGYKYAHHYEAAYVGQEYLPAELRGRRFYRPSQRGYEKKIDQRLDSWLKRKRATLNPSAEDKTAADAPDE